MGTPAKGPLAGLRSNASDGVWADYIRLISAGDTEAMGRLYDEAGTLLYSIALRMLSDPADAEEIVVDVFSQVWRSATSWDSKRGSATAWLVMLCRSRCIDRIRSRALRAGMEAPLTPVELDRVAAPESDNFSFDRERVSRAMTLLPFEHREILELAFFTGYTHTELAERLGVPLGTAKTRIRSAMMRLRDLLKEYST